ncbi:hypothetical protein, partial [Serratia marcescens]|uniref:hypothetical protein n=1 Tax=Serratia marcescens TaxID=615 RepID=UPI0028145A87
TQATGAQQTDDNPVQAEVAGQQQDQTGVDKQAEVPRSDKQAEVRRPDVTPAVENAEVPITSEVQVQHTVENLNETGSQPVNNETEQESQDAS